MMNIIYDISVLGWGYFADRAKTGVYRVINQVAHGLAESNACDVSFSATERNYYHCLQYLRNHAKLPMDRLIIPDNRLLRFSAKLYHYQWFPALVLNRMMMMLFPTNHHRFAHKLFSRSLLESVHLFHSPFFPIPEQIRQAAHIRHVITVYDLIPVLFPQFFLKFREDRLLQRILASITPETWVCCISHSTKHDLCSYKKDLDPAKVVVTHLAASEDFYPCRDRDMLASVRQKYAIPEGQYLLSVGTFEPRKNIAHLIRCFARLITQEQLRDLHLVLVGPKGWDYKRIFTTLSGYRNLQDRIIVTGYVSDEDLAPLYSGALAFVFPSFYEGFGLPPLEAMQCGVPVITSNTSSLPEVVGDAGIMVPPADADALCQGILAIYQNEDVRRSMALKSLKRAKLFNWDACVEQTIASYKHALEN